MKVVFGVGIIEKGKYKTSLGGKVTKEAYIWRGMLERCYCNKYQNKYPSYLGCTVSDNFKDFQYFAEWCNNQIGFGLEGYQLDKDILFKGNKLYSEHTCVFVPKQINYLFTNRKRFRGGLPVGVCFHKPTQKFICQCNNGEGKMKYQGVFDTPQEAFLKYKSTKEALIKRLAEENKDGIDIRVYNAMNSYVVSLED